MRPSALRGVAMLTAALSIGLVHAAPATAARATESGRAAAPVAPAARPPTPISMSVALIADTVITSGPSGLTSSHVSTFTFTSSEAAATFQCRVDVGAFTGCVTPYTTSSLANGAHTFEVRALDAVGDPDPTPASRSFVVDTLAPQTTITGGPSGATDDNTPAFTFMSPDVSATFQCRLDTAEYTVCASPFTAPVLPAGAHTFQVRALDAVGNTDQSPARRDFTVAPAGTVPTCLGKKATIIGSNGDDKITGTRGNDVIVSRGGDDAIDAGGGDDLVCAGRGSDRVAGEGGEDRILGEAGEDRLQGNGRGDRLDGGGGNDKLFGQAGADRLDGGRGRRDDGNGGPGKDVVLRCET